MKPYTELNFDTLPDQNWVSTTRNKKTLKYLNIPAGFDIETTSVTLSDDSKFAFMYVWMVCIGGDENVFYGRTWEQFGEFVDSIKDHYTIDCKNRMVIYVHNLAYEFQFIRKLFDWDVIDYDDPEEGAEIFETPFNIDNRHPIRACTTDGIEFRCSYMLTGLSLERAAKNLVSHTIQKIDGEKYDYKRVRHQETPLTELELQYCRNDALIVAYIADEHITEFGDVTNIPMTNTGRVRQYMRDKCLPRGTKQYDEYSKQMSKMKLDEISFDMLKSAFKGGFTHSNPKLTRKKIADVVSQDINSSYPTVMAAELFPSGSPRHYPNINTLEDLEKLIERGRGVVFDIKFKNIKNKIGGTEAYISLSQCFDVTIKPEGVANGRVMEAEILCTTINEVDLRIISRCYTWEICSVRNVIGFPMNYLPKEFLASMLELYKLKTELKGVEEKAVEYMRSKGMLNSCYGMCVTDFAKDTYTYKNGVWGIQKVDLKGKLDEYNKSKNRFLYYAWGIWITAYARRNLWMAILELREDYVYSDTDSVKYLNPEKHQHFFDKYNIEIQRKLQAMADYHGLDSVLFSPQTIKGETKTLGIWELEGIYKNFKTLGAKRYLVEKQDGSFELTVAGLPKNKGMSFIIKECNGISDAVFDYFDDELTVPASESGKLGHWYIDEETSAAIKDDPIKELRYKGKFVEVTALSGVFLGELEYTLSMAKRYIEFIELFCGNYIDYGEIRGL